VNRYLPHIPVLGIVSIITLSTTPLLALERSEISTRVKEFTVQIEGEDTSGTGTIIEQDGDTYTILTCWHVANTELGLEIITADGETHEVTSVKNIDNGNIDLAIIQFESNAGYEIAELGDSEEIIEGANAYVVGYPDPIPGIPERGYDFQDTNITRKLQTGENGYRLVHNTTTTGGSSGGGIFDEDGVLIGIHGRTTSDAEGRVAYGLAIPLEVFFTEEANLTTPANFTPPQDYASLGRRKLNQKDYQGAVDDFSQVLAINPNNFDALLGRAEAYYWQRDFEAAINDYDLLLQQNDNNATYFFNRGTANAFLENYEEAIADYNEAIRLDPEYANAYNNRGNNYNDLKEYEKAIADLNEAIRLDPEHANAYNNRGISYKNLKEYEKAIADYNEAIRLDPEHAVAYYNRGNNYRNLKEYEKAIADYNEAIRLDPNHAVAYYNRGFSYKSLNNNIQAIQDFQQAADLYQQQGYTGYWYYQALENIKQLQL